MQYNTQKEKLFLPEYGRNIQNMVDHCVSIEDAEERRKCAYTVIDIMGNMFPHLRDVNDFKHIDRGDHNTENGKDRLCLVLIPRAKKNHDLADKVGESRNTGGGHRRHHKADSDKRHDFQEPAQFINVARFGLVGNGARQSEGQCRHNAVGEHQEDNAIDADDIHARKAEKNVSHVAAA